MKKRKKSESAHFYFFGFFMGRGFAAQTILDVLRVGQLKFARDNDMLNPVAAQRVPPFYTDCCPGSIIFYRAFRPGKFQIKGFGGRPGIGGLPEL